MSTIGFDDLFDKEGFNTGLKALKDAIAAITKEIESTKTAADGFSKTMGEELKNKINQLSSASSNFDNELKKVRADFEAFKQSVGQTKQVVNQYETANKSLTKEVNKLEQATKQVTNTTKTSAVNFKGLSQQFLGVASGAALVYRGVQMLKEQLVAAVKSTIAFEKAMKEVQAISRASAEQLNALTANANKLGASTEKTAVEIAGLQKELAKLGFTSTEIIAASQAIVDLSTATGENLAGSATVAAATLRAFGLEAIEMTRVVDVMAGSFVRSGLDLEKFRESMKLVAPIARATNIDVETTTAALSKLADAGLSGSLAGTALRNLFSSMADPTDKLSQFLGYTVTNSQDLIKAFKDLRDRGVDLAQAVQMVDVRARPAFFTLLNQVDSVEALAREYRSLTGEGERLANMMRDTLANDIEIANSAFDALRRNLVEGGIPVMREITQAVTDLIEWLRLLSEGYIINFDNLNPLVDKYIEFLKAVSAPILAIKSAVGFWEEFKDVLRSVGIEIKDLEEAQKDRKFAELNKESAASIELFNRSVKNMEMQKLVDEYKKLDKQVDKTKEQLDRMAEIDKKLRYTFKETAIAIDKTTNKYFLNTEAIERNIKATSDETKTVVASIQARVQEIDSKIALNNKIKDTLGLQADMVKFLKHQKDATAEANQLLAEKAILLKTLSTEYGILIDGAQTGWSVYKEGAKGAKNALEQIKKELAAINTINTDYLIAVAKTAEEEAKIRLDRAKGTESEIERLEEYKNARIKSTRLGLQAELEAIEQSSDANKIKDLKVLIAKEKYKQSVLKIEEDLQKGVLKIIEDTHDKIDEADEKLLNARIERANRLVKATENAYKDIIKLTEELPQKEEETLVILKDVMAWRKKQTKEEELSIKNYIKLKSQQKEIDKEVALNGGLATHEQTEAYIALKEELKEYEELTKRGITNGLREVGRLSTLIFDNAAQRRENELIEIDRWEAERIKLAGDNTEAITAIEEEAAERRKEIKRKQAKADRAEALFQIAIQTAINIVRATNLFERIAMAALGVAQAAIVASKPLPQFAKGTTNAPEGQAIVGEKGREIVWDKRSNTTYVTPDAPTLTYLSKGSVVIPNNQTERILSTKVDRNEIAYDKSTPTSSKSKGGIDYNRLGSTFEKAVTKIPLHQTTFDADGVREFVKRGNNRTERLNRRYKY
jgi:TP901 family phage tail tape measure protein